MTVESLGREGNWIPRAIDNYRDWQVTGITEQEAAAGAPVGALGGHNEDCAGILVESDKTYYQIEPIR